MRACVNATRIRGTWLNVETYLMDPEAKVRQFADAFSSSLSMERNPFAEGVNAPDDEGKGQESQAADIRIKQADGAAGGETPA